jgi:hypothetical protein
LSRSREVLSAIGGLIVNNVAGALLIGVPNLIALAVLQPYDFGFSVYLPLMAFIVIAGSVGLFALGRSFGRRQDLSIAFAIGAAFAPAIVLLRNVGLLLEPPGLVLYGTYALSSAALPAGFVIARRTHKAGDGSTIDAGPDETQTVLTEPAHQADAQKVEST